MITELLPAIEIETGSAPDAAVIWMHGLGDDGHGWSQVVPGLQLPADLRIRFLFPHAPTMPVTINNGHVMRAWYDISDGNLHARADVAGVRALASAGRSARCARDRPRHCAVAHRARGIFAGRRGGAVHRLCGTPSGSPASSPFRRI